MPIRFEQANTQEQNEAEIAKFEAQYDMTSEEFATEAVHEVDNFDAMEWLMLLEVWACYANPSYMEAWRAAGEEGE